MYPLLQLALSNIYAKMAHAKLDKPPKKLYVNNSIHSDLLWAVDHLSRLPGTHVLKSVDWDTSDADITAYCDVSLMGLGFWFPDQSVRFWSRIPEDPPKDTIFYFEALSVLSAIIHSTSLCTLVKRLVVYSDNLNTVQIFNSLSALPAYNDILKGSVDHLLSDIDNLIDLWVIHITGKLNIVADALSRQYFNTVVDYAPGIVVNTFSPPHF